MEQFVVAQSTALTSGSVTELGLQPFAGRTFSLYSLLGLRLRCTALIEKWRCSLFGGLSKKVNRTSIACGSHFEGNKDTRPTTNIEASV